MPKNANNLKTIVKTFDNQIIEQDVKRLCAARYLNNKWNELELKSSKPTQMPINHGNQMWNARN